jgi:hypothetical protein
VTGSYPGSARGYLPQGPQQARKEGNIQRTRISELAALLLKLGAVVFGGPAADVAMMKARSFAAGLTDARRIFFESLREGFRYGDLHQWVIGLDEIVGTTEPSSCSRS